MRNKQAQFWTVQEPSESIIVLVLLSFPLTEERHRPVWFVVNCISECERNDILPDRIFPKHCKIIKYVIN